MNLIVSTIRRASFAALATILSSLPSKHSFAAEPLCEAMSRSAEFQTITIVPNSENPNDRDVRLRYPKSYLSPVPWPIPVSSRATGVLLRMNFQNWEPIVNSTKDRSFLLLVFLNTRYPIRTVAGNLIGSSTGQGFLLPFENVKLDLRPLSDGRSQVENSRFSYNKNDEQFLVMNNGEPTDLITCKKPGTVKYPSCQHFYDSRVIDVEMTYPLEQASHWKEIKEGMERFLSCIALGN